jgi:hypothetical protein
VGEEARDFGIRRLGAGHFATLRTSIGLSIALRRSSLPARETAIEVAEEAYETCRGRLGDSDPDTMAAAINLANVQRVNGLLDEALTLAESMISRYSYGPDHPYTHGCIGNIAVLRRVMGDAVRARELDERAFEGLRNRLGRDHSFTLVVATNLASDHAALGDVAAARALGTDTVSRLTSLLGNHHPFALGCSANLCIDLRMDGATDEADAVHEETMRRYGATLGLTHPDAVAAAAGGRIDFDFDPPPI